MRPLKQEFKNYVQFTDNIEDRIINFHIDDAFYYVVKPILGNKTNNESDLGVAIQELPDTEPSLKPELMKFYSNHVKRWWILIAYKRFLQNHGRNVTQYGYTKLRDPEGTFEQLDGEERAVALRQLQSDINIVEGNLFTELSQVNWTLDGQKFEGSTTCEAKRKTFGIRAVGFNNKKGCGACNKKTEMLLPLPSNNTSDNDYSSEDYD